MVDNTFASPVLFRPVEYGADLVLHSANQVPVGPWEDLGQLTAAQAVMMRSVHEDFGDSYDPAIHADIEDLHTSYVEPQGPCMLVVEDAATGKLVATGGVRGGQINEARTPCHLAHLAQRYRDGRTGQLVRVYVAEEHRRRGIARALVEAILDRARADGDDRFGIAHDRGAPSGQTRRFALQSDRSNGTPFDRWPQPDALLGDVAHVSPEPRGLGALPAVSLA